MDNQKVIDRFKDAIKELKNEFQKMPPDYFFTEKEIHSFFYHLCLERNLWMETDDGRFNLVHTEYPTPFKCITKKKSPSIKRADHNSKHQRAHIDLVLLNPDFVNFVKSNNFDPGLISGIGGRLFSDYIVDYYKKYEEFSCSGNKSILLYALEFKFHRHNYSGAKYPVLYLQQDINKLELMSDYPTKGYCLNAQSLVFVGNRITEKLRVALHKVKEDNKKGICDVVEY